jgi:hypothetical protein
MSEWVVSEYTAADMEVDNNNNEAAPVAVGGPGGQAGPVVIRTTEDILAYIQKKNPKIVPFECEGRMVVKVYDLLMAVCNIKDAAARKVKARLVEKDPELCDRLITTSELHVDELN